MDNKSMVVWGGGHQRNGYQKEDGHSDGYIRYLRVIKWGDGCQI